MWNEPVRKYASASLVTVTPDAFVPDVQQIFEERDISAVPVVDEAGALLGILTTTDLLHAARLEMEAPRARLRIVPPPKRARQVMRSPVITIDESAELHEAATKLVHHRIHRLVVTRDGVAVGVLSTRDMMHAILEQHVEEPLARVITTDVITVDVADTIDVAIERLDESNVHGLVVLDGAWPVGVFTHTEALKARALAPDLRKTQVDRIMSYETICLNVSTPLYRVAGHAFEMNVRRILAVENRKLVGIVTGFDLARFMTLQR